MRERDAAIERQMRRLKAREKRRKKAAPVGKIGVSLPVAGQERKMVKLSKIENDTKPSEYLGQDTESESE